MSMSALPHNILRHDQKRRGRVFRSARPKNIAAVIRPQAPLPVESIAPPPSDAAQSSQWQAYRGIRSNERSNTLSTIAEIGSHDATPAELDYTPGAQHLAIELDAPHREIYQLHGEGVLQEADSLHFGSPVSPLSSATDTPTCQSAPSSAGRSINGRATVESTQQPQLSRMQRTAGEVNTADLESNNNLGFDCPIRAGPHGQNKCTWPPKRENPGFPTLARMREHVGSHGLLCPECDKIFSVPSKYKDHRTQRDQSGTCSNFGAARSGFPKHLTLAPDTILEFFARPKRDVGEQDAWLNGFKILHPNWNRDGGLPHPFYKNNMISNNSPLVQNTPRNDLDPRAYVYSSNDAQIVTPCLSGPMTDYDVSPLSADGAGPTFAVHCLQPTCDATGDLNFARLLDDMTRFYDPNDPPLCADDSLDDMTFQMFGGSLDPNAVSYANGAGQGVHDLNSATEPQSEGTVALNSSQNSVTTSVQSSEIGSNFNPCGISQAESQHDSAMELCEAGSSPVLGAEGSVARYSAKLVAPYSKGKQPARATVASTAARKSGVLKRIDRLTEHVEELYSSNQALSLENRSLHTKVGEVESEKRALLFTISKIRMEVEMWDPDDSESSELDMLGQSMQKIKLLLPN